MSINTDNLTTKITSITVLITALIACGREVYPYVITLLSTMKELISELSNKSDEIGGALVSIYESIQKVIEELQSKLAEEGLVSDDTLENWLKEIDQNIQVILKAAEE